MVNAAQLKELRRLTNAGLSECKRALDESGGDLFAAAASMLTEEDVQSLKSSMMVRASAGQSIKDPVTESERELIEALESHFIAGRTRPANVGFLFETTARFLSDARFRRAIIADADGTLGRIWRNVAGTNSHGPAPQAENFELAKILSTVISMPPSQSEWECDFIVLLHPQRRFVFSSSARVIAVYKRTKRDDFGVATFEEMAGKGDDVRPIRRWFHENAEFSVSALAQVLSDGQLRKLT